MPVANKYELHESWKRVIITLKRPDEGSLLSTAWFTA